MSYYWVVKSFYIRAMLCAKFQNNFSIEMDVMDKRDFARFEFKINFVGISYIATSPSLTHRRTENSDTATRCLQLVHIWKVNCPLNYMNCRNNILDILRMLTPRCTYTLKVFPHQIITRFGLEVRELSVRKLITFCLHLGLSNACWSHPLWRCQEVNILFKQSQSGVSTPST